MDETQPWSADLDEWAAELPPPLPPPLPAPQDDEELPPTEEIEAIPQRQQNYYQALYN